MGYGLRTDVRGMGGLEEWVGWWNGWTRGMGGMGGLVEWVDGWTRGMGGMGTVTVK